MEEKGKEVGLLREGMRLAEESYGEDSKQKAQLLVLTAGALSFAGGWVESEQAVIEAERAFDASGDHGSLYYAQLLKIKGGLLRGHGASGAVAARDALRRAVAVFARSYTNDEGYIGALMYLAGADVALDYFGDAKAVADQAVGAARPVTADASPRPRAI